MTPAKEKCCAHRGADHGRGEDGNLAKAGDPCTMPSCKCKGWVPRKRVPFAKREVRRG